MYVWKKKFRFLDWCCVSTDSFQPWSSDNRFNPRVQKILSSSFSSQHFCCKKKWRRSFPSEYVRSLLMLKRMIFLHRFSSSGCCTLPVWVSVHDICDSKIVCSHTLNWELLSKCSAIRSLSECLENEEIRWNARNVSSWIYIKRISLAVFISWTIIDLVWDRLTSDPSTFKFTICLKRIVNSSSVLFSPLSLRISDPLLLQNPDRFSESNLDFYSASLLESYRKTSFALSVAWKLTHTWQSTFKILSSRPNTRDSCRTYDKRVWGGKNQQGASTSFAQSCESRIHICFTNS